LIFFLSTERIRGPPAARVGEASEHPAARERIKKRAAKTPAAASTMESTNPITGLPSPGERHPVGAESGVVIHHSAGLPRFHSVDNSVVAIAQMVDHFAPSDKSASSD
jgi:hypothetical protein